MIYSRYYPAYHPKAGTPTHFVEKVLNSVGLLSINDLLPGIKEIINENELNKIDAPKNHTIRRGHRYKVGDMYSPRVWTDKPYQSKQIIFAPDFEVKKIYTFEIRTDQYFYLNGCRIYKYDLDLISKNDGLALPDFLDWFKHPKPFDGQIICHNNNTKYDSGAI